MRFKRISICFLILYGDFNAAICRGASVKLLCEHPQYSKLATAGVRPI